MESRAPQLSAIILAGGEGRRMGVPKALLRVQDRPLLEMVLERLRPVCEDLTVVVSQSLMLSLLSRNLNSETGSIDKEEFARTVREGRAGLAMDVLPDKGPLAGLAAGLAASTQPWAFAVSCDAPRVSPRLVEGMQRYTEGNDVVVPEHGGRLQPLQALYRRDAVGPLSLERLRNDHLKLMDLLKDSRLRVHTIPDAEWSGWGVPESSFANLNTPDDLLHLSLSRDMPQHADLS